MGQLNNQYVSSSFQGLLKMTNSTTGVTNTLQTVQTGDGTDTPLKISQTQVDISGSLTITGSLHQSGTFYPDVIDWFSSSIVQNTGSYVLTTNASGVTQYDSYANIALALDPYISGATGSSGTSGTSGTSGQDGSSGTSGVNGSSGTSGQSGSSGTSGTSGTDGSSGTSGQNGSSGTSGTSGVAGSSGTSGTSGTSGQAGSSGTSGQAGSSGTSGNGTSGTSGSSGVSNSFFNYQAKTNATSGDPGSGHIIWNNATQTGSTSINVSDIDVNSDNLDIFLGNLGSGSRITLQDQSIQGNIQVWDIGTSTDNTTYWTYPVTLVSATHQFSNNDPILFIITTTPSGTSGTAGTSGTSGQNGSSGTSGTSGFGSSGTSGADGSSGTSGVGTSGTSGTSGSDGLVGSNGTSGTSGQDGSSGTSGVGTSGTSGSSGTGGGDRNGLITTGSIGTTQAITGSLIISGSQIITGSLSTSQDVLINGLTFGKGGGNVISNVAIGASALSGNTTGLGNVAIGSGSLSFFSNSGNGFNVAIGAGVMNLLGSGSFASVNSINNNTIIGGNSAQSLVSGSRNTIVGANAMQSANNTERNTGLGRGVFSSIGGVSFGNVGSGSQYNSAFGHNAMFGFISGSFNLVAHGGSAGGEGLLYGSRNIILGPDTLVPTSGNTMTIIGRGLTLAQMGGATSSGSVVVSDGSGNIAFSKYTSTGSFNIPSTTNITGSLIVSGSLVVTGNINNLKIWTGSVNVNSIGIGTNTLASSTGSSLNNVAIGDGALRYNVTSANNVAIGNSALQNSTQGFNTAIGGSTLTALLTGESNIAIGSSAVQALTGGTKNTAIGFNSMVNVVTGSNNVAIGSGTLQRNTSGSGCVVIGNQAGGWSTTSNEFFIGNDSLGSADNERSGSLFWGQFANPISSQNLQINANTKIVGNTNVTGSLNVTGSVYVTGSVQGNVNSLSISSNTASLNLSNGNFFTLQLVSGSNTRIEPSNISQGQTVNILLSTTGSATVSFPTSVLQVSGSSYVPTTTTGKDIITLVSFDNSSLYLANVKNLV